MKKYNFTNDGIIILKNALNIKLINNIQKQILSGLLENNRYLKKGKISKNKIGSNLKNNYKIFCNIIRNFQKENMYKFLLNPYKNLISNDLIHEMLLSKKVNNHISDILGKDLAFDYNPSLVINIPNKSTSKENYLFKDWHQEIWSGANHSTLQFWTPIFQENSILGQVEFIPGSHKWGHIPHSNRRPIQLPKKFKSVKSNLNYGDAIIFHSMLLHRSVPLNTKKFIPRLAFPTLIRNFRYINYSFEQYRNWIIYSYSDMTQIERKLGNHYLSPYRLIDITSEQTKGIIKKS